MSLFVIVLSICVVSQQTVKPSAEMFVKMGTHTYAHTRFRDVIKKTVAIPTMHQLVCVPL